MTHKRIRRLLGEFEESLAGAAPPSVDLPHAVQDDETLSAKWEETARHVLERKRKHPKTSGESSRCSQDDEIKRLLATKSILLKEVEGRSGAPTIVASIQELRNVYLHGLQTVSELQDLQDAPDAILPGNFVAPSEGAV